MIRELPPPLISHNKGDQTANGGIALLPFPLAPTLRATTDQCDVLAREEQENVSGRWQEQLGA